MNEEELKDAARVARRAIDRKRECLRESYEELEEFSRTLENVENVLAENESLRADNESLQAQLQEEKELRMRAEMQLSEMSKLSAGVAKKASQDELLKAIRVFVNKSKRKKIEKRIAVKEMVLEMANANSMTLPEDLAVTIDSLDDEQPEAKVVNVAGNYNDIHDNSSVNRA